MMRFTYTLISFLVLISMLLASTSGSSTGLSGSELPVFEPGPSSELDERYQHLEGFRGPLTSRMAVVPLPEDNQDDLDGNGMEDLFEAELSGIGLHETVEAIIWVEHRIDAEFLYYLEHRGAEPYFVTHGVESVGVLATKARLYQLARDPVVSGVIYKNHEMTYALDTSVPVIKAGQSQLSSAGYSEIDGSGITITIIDTGVDGDHRTFPAGKIIAFKDYNGGRDDLDPTNGMDTYDSGQQPHGTMTASAAAGTGGSTKYVGSAPGAYLIVIRVSGSAGSVSNAVQWSINNKNKDFNKDGTPDGPDIISMSLGTSPNSYMDSICVQAVTAGIIFFTSAGNSGPGHPSVTSPARAQDIIAVGAINDNKNVWYYSSRGPGAGGITKPDVMAPGVQVTVAYPGNRWITTSGTSFSCPIAAGAGAMILQLKPTITPAEMMQILHDTAEDRGTSGPDNDYGWGVVDTIAALNSIPTIRELVISQTDIEEDTNVNFDAKTSGNIVKYEWDFDGDGTFDHSSYTNAQTSFVYTESGFYEAKLRITDSESQTLEMTELIIVTNIAPELAIDYPGQNVDEDELLVFNTSATADTPTDYSQLIYSWDFGDGTTLETASTYVTHSYTSRGSYDVSVTVTDNDGAEDSMTLTYTVSNLLPVANAGPNKNANEDDPIFFTAEASYDTPTDAHSLNYTWEMGDGTYIYKKEFYYTYEDSQQYTVSLTVKDNDGGRDKTFVYANIDNVEPTAEVLERDLEVIENDEIVFHAAVNDTVSDLETLEYFWDFDDGTESDWGTARLTEKYTYKHHGNYNVRFKVRDDDGAVAVASVNVEVVNLAPEADFTLSKEEVWEDEPVYFDAGATTDTPNDYMKLKYNWDFNDGSIGTGKSTEHVFRQSGMFLVKLTVVDDDYEESTVTRLVTVMNVLPRAVPSVDRQVAYTGEIFNFTGRSSWDSSSDHNTLVYSWSFGDGSSETGMNVQHPFTEPGDHLVTLTVSDDDGAFHSETLTVEVLERPQPSGISDAFDLNSTEGLLTLVAVILILVMVVMMVALFVSRSRRHRRAAGLAGAAGRGRRKRRSRAVVTRPAPDPRAMYYQDQQAQMSAYGLPPGQYQGGYEPYGMSVQPQTLGGMGMYEAHAYARLPQSTMPQPDPYMSPSGTVDSAPIYTGEVYEGEVAAQYASAGAPPGYIPELPQLPAAAEQDGLTFKPPAQPEQEQAPAEEPGQPELPADKKFCGNCGSAIKGGWFICPNCKEML